MTNERGTHPADAIAAALGQITRAMMRDAEKAREVALEDLYEFVTSSENKAAGFVAVPPATAVWNTRGNFVEIAVAQLGKDDVYDLKKGIKVAIEHMLQGNFILVPCDAKIKGFDPESVVKKLFNANVLNGNAMYDAALLQKSVITFNLEMKRRGAPASNV